MEINTDLQFLYYQEKQGLDWTDPNMEIYKPLIREFDKKMENINLSEVIKLIILSYKEKYAYHKFFKSCFYDTKASIDSPEYPSYLGQYDYYMPTEKMARKDIKHLIMHIDKGIKGEGNARYMKELELEFFKPQDFESIIKSSLKGKDINTSHTSNSTIYKVKDSAISEIEITALQFKLKTNSKKWVAYYG